MERISNFTGENDDISVDLLIGANFVRAFQPLEVIPSEQDGPYASKNVLGWCIVGPIEAPKIDKDVSYNRVAVLQVGRESTAKHHSEVENQYKETFIKEILKNTYMNDFQESKFHNSIIGNLEKVSYEDEKIPHNYG